MDIDAGLQKMRREAEEAWGDERFREWARINKEIRALTAQINDGW